jgi:hypothetical protein
MQPRARMLAKALEQARVALLTPERKPDSNHKVVGAMNPVAVDWNPNPYATTPVGPEDVLAPGDVLVFHGTQNASSMNSILRHGFLVPGSEHPYTKTTLGCACGNMYGRGVYTTTAPDVSKAFAYTDDRKDVVLIAAVLTPGNTFIVDDASDYHVTYMEHERKHRVWASDKDNGPGTVYDTLHVPGYPCYVSASPAALRVLGTFHLRYTAAGRMDVSMGKGFATISDVEWRSAPRLTQWHIAGDTYCVQLSNVRPPKAKDEKFTAKAEEEPRRPRPPAKKSPPAVLHVVVDGRMALDPVAMFVNTLALDVTRWGEVWINGRARVMPHADSRVVLDAAAADPCPLATVLDVIATASDKAHAVVVVGDYADDVVRAAWVDVDAAGYWKRPELFTATFVVAGVDTPSSVLMQFVSHFGAVNPHADPWVAIDDTTVTSFPLVLEKTAFQLAQTYDRMFATVAPVTLCVPYPFAVTGMGFVDWPGDAAPVWDKVLPAAEEFVLVTGWHRTLRVNGVLHRTSPPVADAPTPDALCANVLVRAACALRAHLLARPDTLAQAGGGSNSCEGVTKGVPVSLRSALDVIVATLHKRVVSVTDGDAVPLLRGAMHRFKRIAGELKAYNALTGWMPPKWIGHLASLRFGKRIAKRVRTVRDKEKEGNTAPPPPPTSIITCNEPGITIRVRPAAAAQVEPWCVVVEYVSVTGHTTTVTAAYAHAACDLVMYDDTARMCNAVLPLMIGSPQLKPYLAHVFTGNPMAVLPGQHVALACATLVSIVEKCFRAKDKAALDKGMIDGVLATVAGVVAGATAGRHPRASTELIDYPSLVEVWAHGPTKFDPFDLLVEAVCRECRAYVRTVHKDPGAILSELFRDANPETAAGRATLMRRTSWFFSKFRATNCSPFAVVAMDAYTRDPATFVDRIKADDVTMRGFLAAHRPEWTPGAAQTALFVFGVSRMSNARVAGVAALRDRSPAALDAIIHDAHTEARSRECAAAAAKVAAANRAARRKARRREYAQARVLPVHTVPRLFTSDDLFVLNQTRPKDNQLELEGDGTSGLLRYHCCYPDCPEYLGKRFARAVGLPPDRRLLYRHFAPDQEFGAYVPAFHRVARTLKMRGSATKAHFVSAVNTAFAGNAHYKTWPEHVKTAVLDSIWCSRI